MKFVIVLFFTAIPLTVMACDIPLYVMVKDVEFKGSVTSPLAADVIVNDEDSKQLALDGGLFVSYQGPCKEGNIEDILSSEIEATITTFNQSIELRPSVVRTTVKPSGFLGFLADLFVDDISVEVTDVAFGSSSASFQTTDIGTFESEVELEVLSGKGAAKASILPGGVQTVDLAGETFSLAAQGRLFTNADGLVELRIPNFSIQIAIDADGVVAEFEQTGDLTAVEIV
eukprot:TRINITY_DN6845_c1_g1_i1.p1 TRINITY_DN6845_c1_g1~~TRINITY_DN6845_c1_g1_i1.p1  ORF type:complete len:229 (-),score=35.68 TRINITY_DN6845_c1_g1_i1:288-974(-)